MPDTVGPRRGSLIGPIILIAIGALFLFARFFPDFDAWWIFAHYWPLILVFIGVAKIWDSYWVRNHPDQPSSGISGTVVAVIALVVVFSLLAWHGRQWARSDWRGDWRDAWYYGPVSPMHDTQSIDLQGAKSVSASLEMPAGRLTMQGGATHLLDADFHYDLSDGKPEVSYTVSGDHGQLTLNQGPNRPHFGTSHNDWILRFGNSVPLDMNLQMGAGQSNLRLGDLPLNRLNIEMGAGELNLDLTGDRKTNLDADIQGGAGKALVHLPRNVGFRVHASGGIGSVNAPGLHREGDEYTNDAYGKTPVAIEMNIEGGVGEIDLYSE